MPPLPHVRALKIRNFKGIAKLDLPLDHSLTLLAGINGVGKTSAIEALLGAVTGVWSWLGPDGTEAWFRPSGDLVRYGTREGNIMMELALASDVRTTFTIPFQAKGLEHAKYYDHEVLSDLSKKVSPIPLVVNFDQNRIGGLEANRRWSSETNRQNALDTTPGALSDFKNWYFEKESDEAREAVERSDLAYADPEVRAVQEVLRSIAGSSTVLRSRKPDGSMDRMLFLRKEGGFDTPFEALSGGEQAYFCLRLTWHDDCCWSFRGAHSPKLRVSCALMRSSSICIRRGNVKS